MKLEAVSVAAQEALAVVLRLLAQRLGGECQREELLTREVAQDEGGGVEAAADQRPDRALGVLRLESLQMLGRRVRALHVGQDVLLGPDAGEP